MVTAKIKMIAFGLSLSVALASGYKIAAAHYGKKLLQLKSDYDEQVDAAKDRLRENELLRQQNSDNIAKIAELERTALDQKTKVITKEVIKYVKSNDNSCVHDADWLRIINSAATSN